MQRNFYQKDGSYYYSDNNQKILNVAELQEAAKNGVEVQYSAPEEDESAVYNEAIANDPKIQELVNTGNTLEDVIEALESGNIASLLKADGQPFSAEDQHQAQMDAEEDNRLYYEALQQKETADAEALLAKDQADYQNYLINSGQQFEADKARSDQQSADQGVLFSGSRVQKEKNLQRAYTQDQAYTKSKVASNIGTAASDFQYKYGNEAAQGLSQYYNLGSNTFNTKVARGGVSSGGLSSVYNPSQYNYQGTRKTERSANVQTRAAGYLWNRGNKLLSTGYKNQY